MHFESHAGLGWLLGTAPPGSDHRLRVWCTGAAVLPDVDAAAYFFGPQAYSKYHHTFGHNVFLGAATVAAAAWAFRQETPARRARATALVAVAFASHLLADMKLSAYAVYLFWPFSHRDYEFATNLGLASPVNTALVALSFATAVALAFWRGVTPLDLVSPGLDLRVRRAFMRRTLSCATCGGACSDRCDSCSKPVCSGEGKIGRGLRLACPACAAK